MNKRKISLKITPDNILVIKNILLTEGDKQSHAADITFENLNGITGKKLDLNFRRSDNEVLTQTVDITADSSLEFTLDDRIFELPGKVLIEFVIREADDSKRLTINKILFINVMETTIELHS